MFVYRDDHILHSGFENSIEYLEYNCYFNEITDQEFTVILESFQDYYTSKILQENEEINSSLTSLLCAMHVINSNSKYCRQFFRKLLRDSKLRNNYGFWEIGY